MKAGRGTRDPGFGGAGARGLNLRALDRLGITRLASDSRQVGRGDAFVAYPGETQDGRRYIPQAIAAGARAVLWEARGFAWKPAWRVPNLGVPRLRERAGYIASHVYDHPSARLWMIGVTGTNGKTSCSQWIARALGENGTRCGVIGTLGYGVRGTRATALHPLVNTTPDAVWLHARLADFARRGARAVSMEVSSIGVDQGRVAGAKFDVALFTNLTRDHLDYHGSMRHYRRAKQRLFECETLKHAVFNLDDAFGAELAQRMRRDGLNIIGYGFAHGTRGSGGERVTGSNLVTDRHGVRFDVATPWGKARVSSPLLGSFNASNLLGTLAVLLASGLGLRRAAAALGRLQPLPGRMQTLGGGAQPLVVVDYAHSPDALENVLRTLRALVDAGAHLICVFGCGGERDAGKRPLMGAVASKLADRVVVTSDNPRRENPRAIMADILAGVRGECEVQPDRGRAIEAAIASAQRGDVVLIAGKGHETYQEVRGVRYPFSDVQAARAALTGRRVKRAAARGGGRSRALREPVA